MNATTPLCLLALLAMLQSCATEANTPPPEFYTRAGVLTSHADVYWDTIRSEPPCFDTFTLIPCEVNNFPLSRETWYNCNNRGIERNGDTLYLYGFDYTPPDSEWVIQFHCHSTAERFLIQGDGSTLHVGPGILDHDPNLRLQGDTVRFDMTLVLFDRGSLAIGGGVPVLIRYPQFGTLHNTDSLQQVMASRYDGHNVLHVPHIRVAWQTWTYVPQSAD